MKKVSLIILILFFIIFQTRAQNVTKLVDPFIGTGGHGHTYPGATLPFGMVQLSPDTRIDSWDGCSGYHYSDKIILGFSHTHLSGTGVGDYGDILVMPTIGEVKIQSGGMQNPDLGYSSRFSHSSEEAYPGFYSVVLDDYKIKAKLTTTLRTGFHEYIFPQSKKSNIIIDLHHGIVSEKILDLGIQIVSDTEMIGYRRTQGWAKDQIVFFVIQTSKPFNKAGVYSDGKLVNNYSKMNKGKNLKGFFQFATTRGESVKLKCGISSVDIKGARKNLITENPGWDFQKVKTKAENIWEKKLGQIEIKTPDKNKLITFYTALYHSLLAPNLFMDVDGRYRGMDRKIYQKKNFTNYTVFSLWDTFRATHPLFTILLPKTNIEFIKSLLEKYREGGILPIWELAGNYTGCMIGYHAIPVIADAYLKGGFDVDIKLALEAMKKSADMDHLGLKYYKQMGFIPSDKEGESVSKTLEYAYDDWCIAQVAKKTGDREGFEEFIKRSQNYKNLFDKTTGFFRAKRNGNWVSPFDPREVNFNYTEANAWQYLFFVPHDIFSFIEDMGGFIAFEKKLDKLFSESSKTTGRRQSDITGLIGQYAHGNEPSHHMAYLYNFCFKPHKTQKIINEILKTQYSAEPDGLCGNEDCGQMSSWYVFSTLGFYPVCPGDTNYLLGTPFFKQAVLKLENGNKFVVKAKNLSDSNIYVQEVILNKKKYSKLYISHSDIMNGGELVFKMGKKPVTDMEQNTALLPDSKIKNHLITPVPVIVSKGETFIKKTEVKLTAIRENCKIFYTLDGSSPEENSAVYSQPLIIKNTTTVKAMAVQKGLTKSRIVTAKLKKIHNNKTIRLLSQYNKQYTAGGNNALIDTIRGTENFRCGAWQGYYGEDLIAEIELKNSTKIKKIRIGFLQTIRSWIFLPKKVSVYFSKDGSVYKKAKELIHQTLEKDYDNNFIKELVFEFTSKPKVKFLKIIAESVKKLPPWHVSPGEMGWIFVDEIIINRE